MVPWSSEMASYLDDILLPNIGISDGVGGAVRKLHLQAARGTEKGRVSAEFAMN